MTNNNSDLLATVSRLVEKAFRRDAFIVPVWFALTRDGRRLIVPPPVPYTDVAAKDLAAVMVRAFFEIEHVVSYVYAAESWIVDKPECLSDTDKIQSEGIARHPARREVVVFMSEAESSGLSMSVRDIIRPKKGKPRLGPLVVQDGWDRADGRFSSLLPTRGRPS